MRYPRQARMFRGKLDGTPYAAVFVLLVMFVVMQSSLVYGPGVKIELPVAGDLPGINGPTLVVVVDRSGQMYYRDQVIKEEDLKASLRTDVLAQKTPATLVIQADKSVPNEIIARLGKLASDVGVTRAVLAVRPAVLAPAEAQPSAK